MQRDKVCSDLKRSGGTGTATGRNISYRNFQDVFSLTKSRFGTVPCFIRARTRYPQAFLARVRIYARVLFRNI